MQAVAGVLAVLMLLVLCSCGRSAAAAPERVVSLNLCTDELLLLLATPDQIASVTWLVQEPGLSELAEQAGAYVANHGELEEIIPLQPDLVLAGRYGAQTTVQMLRQLNVRVEVLDAPTSLQAVVQQVQDLGQLLGRAEQASKLVATMQLKMDELGTWPYEQRPVAAVYLPNGYTVASSSLMQDLMTYAGLDNLAVVKGYEHYLFLPLELLVHELPDLLILDEQPSAPSLAHALLRHPVLRSGPVQEVSRLHLPSRFWNCGTPGVLEAVARLRTAALAVMTGSGPGGSPE